MIHPLDGSQTPEDEDRTERAAIIEEGNPGMSRAEAERLALLIVGKNPANVSDG